MTASLGSSTQLLNLLLKLLRLLPPEQQLNKALQVGVERAPALHWLQAQLNIKALVGGVDCKHMAAVTPSKQQSVSWVALDGAVSFGFVQILHLQLKQIHHMYICQTSYTSCGVDFTLCIFWDLQNWLRWSKQTFSSNQTLLHHQQRT
jgi:hypothetical protein